MNTQNETIELLLANRTHLYGIFHAVFGSAPGEELLDLLSAPATPRAFALLSEKDGDAMAEISRFVRKQKEKYLSDPEYLSHVKAEYTKLMIGPGPLIAYPWESAYSGKEKQLFQESTLRVREAYRKYGYLPAHYPRVADDHIALELHFMAKLSETAFEAFQKGDAGNTVRILKDQRAFIRRHMLSWLPEYARDLGSSQTAYFYPQFGQAVSEFVRIDDEAASEIIDTLPVYRINPHSVCP